ncbi:hypothetical protein ElyMa_000043400 [Elysia marginata]|uniref:Uncharacterized protein n=1 Tax=Elysia marginata TaxID=1093978 RepID=A0AAV4EE37_9GAST|nr:hypothetical protein ElyMa_000043400 [Elysia marginata]
MYRMMLNNSSNKSPTPSLKRTLSPSSSSQDPIDSNVPSPVSCARSLGYTKAHKSNSHHHLPHHQQQHLPKSGSTNSAEASSLGNGSASNLYRGPASSNSSSASGKSGSLFPPHGYYPHPSVQNGPSHLSPGHHHVTQQPVHVQGGYPPPPPPAACPPGVSGASPLVHNSLTGAPPNGVLLPSPAPHLPVPASPGLPHYSPLGGGKPGENPTFPFSHQLQHQQHLHSNHSQQHRLGHNSSSPSRSTPGQPTKPTAALPLSSSPPPQSPASSSSLLDQKSKLSSRDYHHHHHHSHHHQQQHSDRENHRDKDGNNKPLSSGHHHSHRHHHHSHQHSNHQHSKERDREKERERASSSSSLRAPLPVTPSSSSVSSSSLQSPRFPSPKPGWPGVVITIISINAKHNANILRSAPASRTANFLLKAKTSCRRTSTSACSPSTSSVG